MYKIVLDTNVLVSAVISPKGNPAKIVSQVLGGKHWICYNDAIMDEYNTVLFRAKFNFNFEKINHILDFFEETGIYVSESAQSEIYFADESDRVFYDVAKTCAALLVTGNKKHYPDESFVKLPAEFLEWISGSG